MKIILLQDVKSLGKEGEIITVSDGYARNYIIPKKLGLEATTKNLNDLKLKKKYDARMAEGVLEDAQALAKRLEEGQIELEMKVGDGERLFGSVSNKEIAEATREQLGLKIDKKKILLKEVIKSLGTHTVPVKLHSQVVGELTVIVKAEK
jgi:large subunit ribosomal protein L9